MTVPSEVRRNDYVGTSSTATYSYSFRIFAATDLLVTKVDTLGVETTLVYPTDYSVTGVGSFNYGNITLTAGNLPTGYGLTIRFKTTLTQNTDIRNQGGFYPSTVEDALDRLTRIDQQQQDEVDRGLRLPETEAGTAALRTLPTAAARASKFLGFDGSGNPIAAVGTVPAGPVSAFVNTLLDDVDAPTAQATLGGTTVGKAVFTAVSAAAALSALGAAADASVVHTTGNETVGGNKTLTGTLALTAKAINEAKGAAVAVAATTDIWTPADGQTVHLTGNGTAASLGTAPQAGARRHCIVDGTPTFTNGANLVCPGGADITWAAGDSFDVFADTTTKMLIEKPTKADGGYLKLLSDFAKNLASPGYQKLPGGLVLQWGLSGAIPVFATGVPGTVVITFPVAFATSFLMGQATAASRPDYALSLSSPSTTQMTINNWSTAQTPTAYWFALGH